MKRNFCLKSVFAAICSLFLSVTAFASTTYTQGYFNYQISDKSVIITNYFGDEEIVTVPSMIAGYPVSEIAANAFAKAETVKHISLPDTIMEVQARAVGMGVSVMYNSNTDNPVGTQPEIIIPDKEDEMNEEEWIEDIDKNSSSDKKNNNNNVSNDELISSSDKEFSIGGAEADMDDLVNETSDADKKDIPTENLNDENETEKVTESETEVVTEVENETESETEVETETETEVETETETEVETETETETEAAAEPITEAAKEPEKSNSFLIWVLAAAVILVCFKRNRKK